MTPKAPAGWACISGHRQRINYDCYTYTENRNVARWLCCVTMLTQSLVARLESVQEGYVYWVSCHMDGDSKAHIHSSLISPKLHILVLFASHVWGKETHLFLALCCRWSLVWCSSFFYFGMCLCHSVSFADGLKNTSVRVWLLFLIVFYAILFFLFKMVFGPDMA